MATRDGVPVSVRARLELLPMPTAEFMFAIELGRGWRFDWAWPAYKVALEIEGGLYAQGRHARHAGIRGDMEKYNTAQILGWIVLRCLPNEVADDRTWEYIRRAIAARRLERQVPA